MSALVDTRASGMFIIEKVVGKLGLNVDDTDVFI